MTLRRRCDLCHYRAFPLESLFIFACCILDNLPLGPARLDLEPQIKQGQQGRINILKNDHLSTYFPLQFALSSFALELTSVLLDFMKNLGFPVLLCSSTPICLLS